MNVRETLEQELNSLKQRIIENHIRAGQVASGKTIESMQVVVDELGTEYIATLYGRPYFGNLETGNSPWKNTPKRVPLFFHDIIADWIQAKGLSLNAWAVTYKIIHEGTVLHRYGGRRDIFSNVIPDSLNSISDALVAIYDMQITEMITLNSIKI